MARCDKQTSNVQFWGNLYKDMKTIGLQQSNNPTQKIMTPCCSEEKTFIELQATY